MKKFTEKFEGKIGTIMGLGLLGRGLKDTLFLAKYCEKLIVTDLKNENDLQKSVDQIRHLKNIELHLGEHKMEDFENADFVLKGAGIPVDSPYIKNAVQNNIPVYMDESLFYEITETIGPKIKLIGVTGTRGKTTTTHMIYECVKKWLQNQEDDEEIKQTENQSQGESQNESENEDKNFLKRSKKVFLAGNIQDTATLPLLEEIQEGDIVVCELSSWQLQGFGNIKMSPHVSVFTNFYPDHLNYYKNDLDLYFADKAEIFNYQKPDDFLIMSSQSYEQLSSREIYNPQSQLIISDSLPSDWKLSVIGEHNRHNACLAMSALRKLDIPDSFIQECLEDFKGVSGRLEFLGNFSGVKIYNDTTSTTFVALKNALLSVSGELDAFDQRKRIILIMGGNDKGIDFDEELEKIMKQVCKTVILTPGTGSDKIISMFQDIEIFNATSTEEAVEMAKNKAVLKDVILFSPAFSSFAEFKNEYDRGEKFISWVKKYFGSPTLFS